MILKMFLITISPKQIIPCHILCRIYNPNVFTASNLTDIRVVKYCLPTIKQRDKLSGWSWFIKEVCLRWKVKILFVNTLLLIKICILSDILPKNFYGFGIVLCPLEWPRLIYVFVLGRNKHTYRVYLWKVSKYCLFCG